MTTEELLQPRYKVMQPYPYSVFEVGEILISEFNDVWFGIPDKEEYGRSQIHLNLIVKFPHLFKKLEWWEEREIKDLPDYIKKKYNKIVYKVDEWKFGSLDSVYCYTDNNSRYVEIERPYLPATIDEYNEYQKLKA